MENTTETIPEPSEEGTSKKRLMDGDEDEQFFNPDEIKPSEQKIFDVNVTFWWDGGIKVKTGETFQPRCFDTTIDHMTRLDLGRPSQTHSNTKRGRYIQVRPAGGQPYHLAFDATIRTAAPFQKKAKPGILGCGSFHQKA